MLVIKRMAGLHLYEYATVYEEICFVISDIDPVMEDLDALLLNHFSLSTRTPLNLLSDGKCGKPNPRPFNAINLLVVSFGTRIELTASWLESWKQFNHPAAVAYLKDLFSFMEVAVAKKSNATPSTTFRELPPEDLNVIAGGMFPVRVG